MKYYANIIIIAVVVLCGNMYAQGYPGIAGINYSTGLTTSDTKNFISEFSWRGFGLEYKKFLNRNLTAGFFTGWNIFDEMHKRETIELAQGAVTGTQIRYFNAFPIMATFEYYMGHKKSSVRPYIGLAVGTYYIIQRLELGVYLLEEDNWHFGLAPVIGILIPTDYIFLNLSVKYNHASEAGKSIAGDPVGFSYYTINAGISVPTW
jgi:hypothetical protein